MRRLTLAGVLLFTFATPLAHGDMLPSSLPSQTADPLLAPCLKNGAVELREGSSERAGCLIWFYATAGTSRFYTYVYPQRLAILVDWYRVLNSKDRDGRFRTWGLINDPSCRSPQTPEESRASFGFDLCPGDDVLLQYVGKRGRAFESAYREDRRDPACLFPDAPHPDTDPHAVRQDPCDLEFGTSAGVFGLRKFPNPKFDAAKWAALNNGRVDTWECYRRDLDGCPKLKALSSPINPLTDGSIEPPFRIGMSCGACHIGLNPMNPPRDPAHPGIANISGTVGNQYSRVLPIFVSGMPPDTLEYQVFAKVNAGTVDTSAIPNDGINNTGTMNALIDLAARPTHEVQLTKWRRLAGPCAPGDPNCWCELPGKCWEKHARPERIHNILKGGEDSIGILEALQRVYVNTGSCSESAWVDHLANRFELHPDRRGFGQTPFRIAQARRDCPQWRAIEDRVYDIGQFLMTGRPFDLQAALGKSDAEFEAFLKDRFHGDPQQGMKVFESRCARCHSSRQDLNDPPKSTWKDWSKKGAKGVREDWLGSDALEPVNKLRLNYSRALHANHLRGHLYEEFASTEYFGRTGVSDAIPDAELADSEPCFRMTVAGGRGYYRSVSLISVWATAPYMHDNGIGPEVCGSRQDEYCIDPAHAVLFESVIDVEGRLALFEASMGELFDPSRRQRQLKTTGVARVILPLGMQIHFDVDRSGQGRPAAAIGNFNYKRLFGDLADPSMVPRRLAALERGLETRCLAQHRTSVAAAFARINEDFLNLVKAARELRVLYTGSLDFDEKRGTLAGHPQFVDEGHPPMSEQQQRDLLTFLATL